jgi:hypothetical protein
MGLLVEKGRCGCTIDQKMVVVHRSLCVPTRLMVILIVGTTSSHILFSLKDLKNCDSYPVCCFTYKCCTWY